MAGKSTADKVDAMVADYLAGMTGPEVAAKHGVSHPTVFWWLRKRGIPSRRGGPKRGNEDVPEAVVVADYLSGMHSTEVAKKHGLAFSTVLNMVRRAGGAVREQTDSRRLYPLDDAVFADPTAEGRYWVGFLLADGGLQARADGDDRDSVAVALSEVDVEHLRKFQAFLKTTKPIDPVPNKVPPAVVLQISSKRIVNDLLKWNITPRKSFTVVPHPDMVLCPHFQRGVLDGDGCLSWTKGGVPTLQVCGTYATCEAFAKWAETVIGEPRTPCRNNSIWTVNYAGRNAVPLTNALYADPTPALDRKLEIARRFAAWVPRQRDWSDVTEDELREAFGRLRSWRKVAAEMGVGYANLMRVKRLRGMVSNRVGGRAPNVACSSPVRQPSTPGVGVS